VKKIRSPKVGFMVCSNYSGIKNEYGEEFSVHGLAEIAARKLEEKGIEVIRYKELVSGLIKKWQIENYNKDAVVDSEVKSNEAFDKFYQEDVDCIVMFFSSFVFSSQYMQGLNRANKPILLWSGDGLEGDMALGLFCQKGAMDAVGIDYKAVYGMPDDKEKLGEVVSFIKASMVRNVLRRSKFGQWGSNPMGMFGGMMNDWEWLQKFGVIAEHLECSTIKELAFKIPDEECKHVYEKLKKCVKSIPPFEDKVFRDNIKFFLAHKRLKEEYNLDFDGIKCIRELSDDPNFTCPCVGHALIWEDSGYISGCTSEPLGALTMYIMRLLTNEDTSIFQGDFEGVDFNKSIAIMDTSAAAPFNMADEKGAYIKKGAYLGEGGSESYWVHLIGKKGPVTFARLNYVKGEFLMLIAKGMAIDTEEEYIRKSGWPSGPHVTIKIDGDAKKFVDNIRSQYNYIVYEDVVNDLIELCKILNIKYIYC